MYLVTVVSSSKSSFCFNFDDYSSWKSKNPTIQIIRFHKRIYNTEMSTFWKVCSFLHSVLPKLLLWPLFHRGFYLTCTFNVLFNVNSPLFCQYLLWIKVPASRRIVSPVIHTLCFTVTKCLLSNNFLLSSTTMKTVYLCCHTGQGIILRNL